MYSQMIAMADATLAANERLRVEAVTLRVQSQALFVRYRAHRMLDVRGGADEPVPDAAATIRAKLRSGALPLPADPPAKSWVGKGTSRRCEGCDKTITPDEIEYETDLADGRTLRLHADCVAFWHAARAEQITADTAVPEQRLVVIAALLMERPLCSDCLCMKAEIGPAALRECFARMERAVVVNERVERCGACDRSTTVFSLLRRPPGTGLPA